MHVLHLDLFMVPYIRIVYHPMIEGLRNEDDNMADVRKVDRNKKVIKNSGYI